MILLQPWWLLPALGFLALYFLMHTASNNGWRKIISAPVLRFLQRGPSNGPVRPRALLLSAITCTAMSGPAIQSENSESFQHTQGWIILADVSRSMTLTDISPSRLSALRDSALALANRTNANSSTLIVYAGDAFIVAPPSFDSNHIKNNINLLEYGIVPTDGSNITRALSLAWTVIDRAGLVNARLFVLSDTGGFNTRSDAAIARLASLGHRTDFLLFGSHESDNAMPYDLKTAQTLAESGGGITLEANSLGQVNYSELQLDKLDINNQFLTQTGIATLQWSNQSHWILLLAIPLTLLSFRQVFR